MFAAEVWYKKKNLLMKALQQWRIQEISKPLTLRSMHLNREYIVRPSPFYPGFRTPLKMTRFATVYCYFESILILAIHIDCLLSQLKQSWSDLFVVYMHVLNITGLMQALTANDLYYTCDVNGSLFFADYYALSIVD